MLTRLSAALCFVCLTAFAPAPFPKRVSEPRLQIWLDPVRLAAHGLERTDVPIALAPSGFANGMSHPLRMAWRGEFLLEVSGKPAQPLPGPENFANVILRATPEGEVVRLQDVARLRLRAR